MKLYLVRDPRDGAYYLTDTATFKTHVDNQAVADDGIRSFGWIAQPQGGPWELSWRGSRCSTGCRACRHEP